MKNYREYKVMKNGLGEYGIWYRFPTEEKHLHLASKKFFKKEETAKKYAVLFKNKELR